MNQQRRQQTFIGAASTSASRFRRLCALGLIGLGGTLGACTDPPVDPQQPAPAGVITGSLLYVGPRVQCDYTAGVPTQVKGRVLMTLIDEANPLPPQGTATRPVDFLSVGGEDIFTDLATQCLPEVWTESDLDQNISVSVSFRWPHIPLGAPLSAADLLDPVKVAAAQKGYRIQGFYDQEGDFNPLFAVQQTTTRGDIAGAAIEDPLAALPKYRVIRFDSESLRPQGQLVEGISVSFGATVLTEPGLMRVSSGAIPSEFVVPASYLPWDYPSIDITLYGRATTDADRVPLDRTLGALGFGDFVHFDQAAQYAFYVRPVDVDSNGETDCTGASGDPDCHPFFGSVLGAQWFSPVVFLQRYQNAIETQSGIPSVAFIPEAGLLTGLGDPAPAAVQYPDTKLRVYPLAAVMPSPTHPECRALYFADGSSPVVINMLLGMLPPGTVGECAELPTGNYSINSLGGLAGDRSSVVTDATAASETGYNITGGNFAAQVWRIPNELGDYNQVGDSLIPGHTDPGPSRCLAASDTNTAQPLCLPEQSLEGSVVVHDPNATNAPSRRDPVGGAATCSAYPGLSTNPWAPDPAPTAKYDDYCCAPIQHLCNVPLCPLDTNVNQTWSTSAMTMRTAPTSIVGTTTYTMDGATVQVAIPNCVPFDMPQQCCPGTRP